MKVRKYQASEERTILTAMIVHTGVLHKLGRNLKGDDKPFRSKWSNQVAKWCLEHWSKYGKAPRHSIETCFSRYAQESKDQDTVELLDTFLSGLSNDYKALARETNEQYLVDLAANYFKKIRLERTAKDIEASLERNDPDGAEVSLSSYQKIEFATTDWIDPFNIGTIKETLAEEESNNLIQFPGALGEFLNDQFERDAFIAFAGPEKRGKSYWLSEVVWQAVRQRRRVLYYVVGDMSKRQALRRLYIRSARNPLHAKVLQRPVRFKGTELVMEEREFKALSIKQVHQAMQEMMAKTAAKLPRLKIKCVESSTISASDIERDCADLSKEDWVPDVVVIDYADILSPEVHCKAWEYRHQVNETWKVMRRISQKYHCLVVTATQTSAQSYDATLIKKSHFSEDKRKAAHITGMLGINQNSEDEKPKGIYRLNWTFLRDGHWSDAHTVRTAGNLALACPCIISSF